MNEPTVEADDVRQRVITLVDNWAGDNATARVAVLAGLLFRVVDRAPAIVAQAIDDGVRELAEIEYEVERDDDA